MNLQNKGVLRRSGRKTNTVHASVWNSDVWLLVTRLAIMQACLLAIWIAPVLHEGHEGQGVVGWVPQDILERPLPLRRDIGNLHEKVTTSSAEAQAFYDQGLNYLASYVWIEAARSFHQALRLDSSLSAAFVGLCDVYVQLQDVPAARAALEKAQSLSSNITKAERRRVEIRARLVDFLEDKQNLDKFVAYRKAIYDALMASPLDPGLWILRGFADEGPGAGHGQTGDLDSIAFYQTALAVSPNNSAAHHYLAHSYENIGRTDEALSHSEAYLRASSSIPHAHHMRGHELRRGGRIEEAIAEFSKANDLENAYYQTENISAEYDWHRGNLLSTVGANESGGETAKGSVCSADTQRPCGIRAQTVARVFAGARQNTGSSRAVSTPAAKPLKDGAICGTHAYWARSGCDESHRRSREGTGVGAGRPRSRPRYGGGPSALVL